MRNQYLYGLVSTCVSSRNMPIKILMWCRDCIMPHSKHRYCLRVLSYNAAMQQNVQVAPGFKHCKWLLHQFMPTKSSIHHTPPCASQTIISSLAGVAIRRICTSLFRRCPVSGTLSSMLGTTGCASWLRLKKLTSRSRVACSRKVPITIAMKPQSSVPTCRAVCGSCNPPH